MVQDTDLSRFVSSLLPSALQGGYSHRALLAFNIGVMHEYIVRCKILDEGIVGFVVSALVEALKGGSDGNVVVRALKSIGSSNLLTVFAAWKLRSAFDSFSEMPSRVPSYNGHHCVNGRICTSCFYWKFCQSCRSRLRASSPGGRL